MLDDDGEFDVEGPEEDRDAQLEPRPENCAWHVAGSHQAGPVSHCRRGKVKSLRTYRENAVGVKTDPSSSATYKNWSLAGFETKWHCGEGVFLAYSIVL